MLNPDKLSKDITDAFKESLPGALEEAIKTLFPSKSDMGDEMAKNAANIITEAISEPIGERLGNAIHSYIMNISIKGTLITNGSPSTHTCMVAPATPITAGKVPNTLGVQ